MWHRQSRGCDLLLIRIMSLRVHTHSLTTHAEFEAAGLPHSHGARQSKTLPQLFSFKAKRWVRGHRCQVHVSFESATGDRRSPKTLGHKPPTTHSKAHDHTKGHVSHWNTHASCRSPGRESPTPPGVQYCLHGSLASACASVGAAPQHRAVSNRLRSYECLPLLAAERINHSALWSF